MTRSAATRVLIASRLFPPEPGAAAYRLGALASWLGAHDSVVEVLTTRPPASDRDSGEITDPAGVHVSRWPVLRDEGGNVRGYVQFASFDGPLLWRLLTARRPDVVVVEPPPTTGTVVRLVTMLRRVPYVYYAGDVSSTAARGIGVPAPIVAVLTRVEAWAMSGAAGVLAVSQGVADEVVRLTRGRVPVTVVGTGVDTEVFAPPPGAVATPHPTLVYAGTMSEIQGAGVFVDAFAAVAAEFPTARLLVCGQGSQRDELRRRAEAIAPGRVEFRGMLSGREVAAEMSTAWAGLASLHPGVGYDYAFPTKMFATTACGTPVLYAGPGPGRAMVTSHSLGWACDWEATQVADLMRGALAAPPSCDERARLRTWTETNASQTVVASVAGTVVLGGCRSQAVTDWRLRACGRTRPGQRRPEVPEVAVLPLVEQLGQHLPLEQGDTAGVVGRLGEVEDGVGETELVQRAQLLDHLLGGADGRALAVVGQQLVDPGLRRTDGQQPVAHGGEALLHLPLGAADEDVEVAAADDLAEVATHVVTVTLEDCALRGEPLGAGVEVRVVGVLRRDAQRLLLATAGDPHRDAVVL